LQDEYRHFVAGGTAQVKEMPNPAPDWISERSWLEILSLESMPRFHAFVDDFPNRVDGFRLIFDSSEPHR
jgi:dynein heavy chain